MKPMNNTKSAMRLINSSKNKLNNSKRQMLTNTPQVLVKDVQKWVPFNNKIK